MRREQALVFGGDGAISISAAVVDEDDDGDSEDYELGYQVVLEKLVEGAEAWVLGEQFLEHCQMIDWRDYY